MDQSAPILRLSLINITERPTYSFKQNNVEILAMYDSGAVIPVWCSSEKVLLKAYPDAVLIDKIGFISGFGKDKEECKIFKIPMFELTEDNLSYKIVNLYIASCQRPQIGCSLIMSETMFSKTDTLIKRQGSKCFELYSEKSEYQCTFKYYTPDKFDISVWAQTSNTN